MTAKQPRTLQEGNLDYWWEIRQGDDEVADWQCGRSIADCLLLLDEATGPFQLRAVYRFQELGQGSYQRKDHDTFAIQQEDEAIRGYFEREVAAYCEKRAKELHAKEMHPCALCGKPASAANLAREITISDEGGAPQTIRYYGCDDTHFDMLGTASLSVMLQSVGYPSNRTTRPTTLVAPPRERERSHLPQPVQVPPRESGRNREQRLRREERVNEWLQQAYQLGQQHAPQEPINLQASQDLAERIYREIVVPASKRRQLYTDEMYDAGINSRSWQQHFFEGMLNVAFGSLEQNGPELYDSIFPRLGRIIRKPAAS